MTKQHLTRQRGQQGELTAINYLVSNGLDLIEQNVRYPFGEIDLVMRDSNSWIFVEVKYRHSKQYGGAINAVSYRQQQRLRKAALHYMQIKRIDAICRFDVIAIDNDQIQWLKNAF